MGNLSLKSADKDTGFPARMRNLRIKKKFTQEELGQIVGIHANHLGRYERNLSVPSADTLAKLADALDVSSEYLFEGKNENAFKATFSDRELLDMFQAIEDFADEDKQPIKKVIEAYINNIKVKKMHAT